MDEFVEKGNLFLLYSGLLKENQKKVYAYHIMEDMSFSEIGIEMNITRQAAQYLYSKADEQLRFMEENLQLGKKWLHIRALAEKIAEQSGDEEIKKLAGEIMHGI